MYSWVLPILPYMENQELYNQWTMFNPAGVSRTMTLDPTNYVVGQASNFKIGNTAIGILKCPDDNTAQLNEGNLSYAVNGGFCPLAAVRPYGWAGNRRAYWLTAVLPLPRCIWAGTSLQRPPTKSADLPEARRVFPRVDVPARHSRPSPLEYPLDAQLASSTGPAARS